MKKFKEWLVTESTNGYIEGEDIDFDTMCQNAEEYALYFMKQEDLSKNREHYENSIYLSDI